MSYTQLGATIVLGLPIPTASGSTGPTIDVDQILGDYQNDPLVKYMTAVRPGIFDPATPDFVNKVYDSLIEMEYQGLPSLTVGRSVMSAAAARAVASTAPLAATGQDVSQLTVQMTHALYLNQLLPIAQKVAAMPPIPKTVKLHFPPGMIKCMQAGGKWSNGTCTMPVTRAGTLVTSAQPVTPSMPQRPGESNYKTWVFIAGGAVVLGGIAYVVTRKKAA